VGDVTGDGLADIAAAMSFKGSQVKVFENRFNDAAALSFTQFSAFSPFGAKFKGGATVAVADMGAASTEGGRQFDSSFLDGRDEVIVGNEAARRSTVKVFTFFGASRKATAVRTFLPFAASFRGGLSLDVARVNSDLVPDIIVGAGNGGESQVLVLDGVTRAVISNFAAFTAFEATPSHNAPIDVAAVDMDLDGIAESIAVAQGTDGAVGEIRRFNALTGALEAALPESAFDTVFQGNPIDDFDKAYFIAVLDVEEDGPPGEPLTGALVDAFFDNFRGL
jgi:hypothetical protein